MRHPKRTNPAEAGPGKLLAGDTFNRKFTAPNEFWKDWRGPASMAPAIHRKPPKPSNTFWRPEGGGR